MLTPSVDAKTAAKRARRIETAPHSWRGILARSWSPKCSPRAAIKAQCGECQGFDREAIAGCSSTACPLFSFRPFKTGGQP